MYISSSNIDIFPISKNRTNFPTARALSEANLVKWHRRICDKDSYVITKTFNKYEPFEFMLHGYYVKLENKDGIQFSLDDGDIYAHIILDVTNPNYPVLYGSDELDESDKEFYNGVSFTNSELLEDDMIPSQLAEKEVYSLCILSKAGSSYRVPVDALVKFSSSSLEGEIDGGIDEYVDDVLES